MGRQSAKWVCGLMTISCFQRAGAAETVPTKRDGSPFGAVTIYGREDPPRTPALEALPLQSSATRHGITRYFERACRVGRLIDGDPCVVGPVTIGDDEKIPIEVP